MAMVTRGTWLHSGQAVGMSPPSGSPARGQLTPGYVEMYLRIDIFVDIIVDMSGRYTLYLLGCHRRVPVSSPLQQPPRVSDSSIETRVGHS